MQKGRWSPCVDARLALKNKQVQNGLWGDSALRGMAMKMISAAVIQKLCVVGACLMLSAVQAKATVYSVYQYDGETVPTTITNYDYMGNVTGVSASSQAISATITFPFDTRKVSGSFIGLVTFTQTYFIFTLQPSCCFYYGVDGFGQITLASGQIADWDIYEKYFDTFYYREVTTSSSGDSYYSTFVIVTPDVPFSIEELGIASPNFNGWSGPAVYMDGVLQTTPLPATLPLFASGLAAFGLLGWRRKKSSLAIAT